MAKTASTQMTMRHYEDQGFHTWKCEYYFKQPGMPFGRRKDLLGFIDILACPYAWDWLLNPSHRIHVVGWKKYDKPVNRKYWRPTVKEITLEDFVDGRPIEAEDG